MPILRAPHRRAAFPAPTIALACLVALLAAAPSGAQHLYFDANGDGINTSADVIAPSGATALDVWLRTDSNGDGLPAECPSADGPLTIAGYEFIVRASNGTVAWNSYVNLAPGYGVALGDASNATDFRTGYSGPMLAAGTYRLGTLTVTPSSGTPSLGFATASPLDPSYMTAFVSACSGNDLDNTLKLGLDWFDTAGAAYGGTANTAPVFQPAAAIEMDEGTTRVEPLAATDGEGDPVAFSLLAGPSFAAVATTDAGSGAAAGTLTLTPGFADSGSYALSVAASDEFLETKAEIALTVRNANRPPVFNIVPMPMVPEGADEEYAVSVVDVDDDALVLRIVSAPTYVTLGISNSDYGFVSAVLRFRPGYFDAGMTSVTLGAFDGTTETTQLIDVMIRNVNRVPVMAAPDTVSAREGEPVVFDAVVRDPDGEFASFSGDGLPAGATFVDGMNNIGRFTWLPRYDQAGDYAVILRADDGAGGVAERRVGIGVADEGAAIALSQPFDMIVGEGSVQEQTVHATDASGDPIAITLGAGPAYATVSTTDAGTGMAQGVVRLAPGFEDAGEADVTLRASDGILASERTFHVTVADQPPGPPPDGPPFAPPFQTVLTAQTPHSVVAADLNADGHLDLAVTALGSNMVSIFLAVGDGTFQMRRDYPTAVRPHTVVARDLNGDGVLDLALSNIGSNSVSSMLGLGDGTFGPRRDFPLGGSPVFAGVAEFDGDGILDIVATNQTIGALMFLHGNGDGTFGVAVPFTADAGSHGLAIADLNADGKQDVVLANDVAHTASVHLGRGDGTFEPANVMHVGEPHTVATGDANGDGRLDIVTSNYHDGTVTILHGSGDGAFVEGPTFATGADAHASTLADVDGDGITDLIVVNQGSGTASFFMGLGGGAFTPKLDYTVGSGAHSIFVTDMDQDGGVDVVVSCIFANTVRILKNQRPAPVPAAAWPGPDDRFLVLRAEKPSWTLYAERMDGGGLADVFDPVAIVPGSVRLRSQGTGSISEIAAVEGKGAAITDRDKDGVPEAALHFRRADLRLLFGNLRGRHDVPVEVAGRLEGGRRFRCDALISLIAAGPPGHDPVTVAPNPLNPAGAVSFTTRAAGPARVTVVDVQGRKVATLLETPMLGAGDHSLTLRADRRIASGIYFVRVETSDGVRSARFTLLK